MKKATCTLLALAILGVIPSRMALCAGIPVFDASNMAQNTVSALESVSQTLKQIEQYTLQLQQYEDQIKNSLAPAAYVWSQAQGTMNKLMELQDQVGYYSRQSGSLDAYLQKFGNVNYYRDSPYFGSSPTDTQRKAFMESDELGLNAQKFANDNMARTLEQQQSALKDDAANLQRLQQNAQTARGRLEAIQYANQLAAHQANQMLQIRALLMAQHAAQNAKAETDAAREARSKAVTDKALETNYQKSSGRVWMP